MSQEKHERSSLDQDRKLILKDCQIPNRKRHLRCSFASQIFGKNCRDLTHPNRNHAHTHTLGEHRIEINAVDFKHGVRR